MTSPRDRFVLDTQLNKDGRECGISDPAAREAVRLSVEAFLAEYTPSDALLTR